MEKSNPRLCCVPECGGIVTPKTARGMCSVHYSRWRRFGSTELPDHGWMKDRPCVAPGCSQPGRRFDYCDGHSQRLERPGVVDAPLQKRAKERLCVVCGARDWPPNGRRVCCSAICFYYKQKYGGPPPVTGICVTCGDTYNLVVNGRRKQTSTKFCPRCKSARTLRHKTSVSVLAKRDGLACGICGDAVDMSLKRPDLFSPSVDHIVPRGRGGSNEPDNLQLAHLYCNFVKNDRVGFTL